ncbi:TolB family protein [Ferdinandcohnia sp. Marseille-Q9671]
MSFFYRVRQNGKIAYTSTRGGQHDIWIYNVHNGDRLQLTNGLADTNSKPIWSGDNSKIAFVGKNRIVYIVYLSTLRIAAIDQIDPDKDLTLDWSPDNKTVVYTTRNQILMYDVVSHRAKSIPEEEASDVQWFPSGKELLFQSVDESGSQQLFQISSDGTGRSQITTTLEGPLNTVSLSPDGLFALYTTPGASISLIRTVDLSTGEVFEIEGGGQAKNYFPTWAPNSQLIAFSATAFAEGTGYYNEIRVVGKRGESERVLATSSCFATPVTWSPDSRTIAFLSGCNEMGYATEIWFVDLQNPIPALVVREPLISNLTWSSANVQPSRKLFSNELFRVRFYYPSNWQKINNERYEGADGFFQISAISGGNDIHEVCRGEAYHQLMPYGSTPRVFHTKIRGQDACFIYPSADQPPEMNSQAAAIVRYPIPVQIEGATYNYFILWADEVHLNQIARTIQFI